MRGRGGGGWRRREREARESWAGGRTRSSQSKESQRSLLLPSSAEDCFSSIKLHCFASSMPIIIDTLWTCNCTELHNIQNLNNIILCMYVVRMYLDTM